MHSAGPRAKHVDTRLFCVQERVQDGDLSIKKGLPSKLCADVETKPVSASVLQQHCNVSGLYSTDHGPHTPPQDDGTSVGSIQRRMCETERETDNGRNW